MKIGLRKEDWFEKGICTLPIKEEHWCSSDYCGVEVNQATFTCWGYYQILNIGVSLSTYKKYTIDDIFVERILLTLQNYTSLIYQNQQTIKHILKKNI